MNRWRWALRFQSPAVLRASKCALAPGEDLSEPNAQMEPAAASQLFLIWRHMITVFLPLARATGAEPANALRHLASANLLRSSLSSTSTRAPTSVPIPEKLVIAGASGCCSKEARACSSRSSAPWQAPSSWRSKAASWAPIAFSTNAGWRRRSARKASNNRCASVSRPRVRPALANSALRRTLVSLAARAGIAANARMNRASERVKPPVGRSAKASSAAG